MSLHPLFGSSATESSDGQWISISDLMAGLMVIFLFIAISYIRPIVETQDRIRSIVVAWNESEVRIHDALLEEFTDDLPRWNAELNKETLSIRFKAPNILFEIDRAELKPDFRKILNEFFPRYIDVLHQFDEAIAEIRIEGHTSSEWNSKTNADEAYFLNMALSQERTRSVLEYGLDILLEDKYRKWAKAQITANGLSSSQPIKKDGLEQAEASRRVEFRVRTNAKKQIVRVLETIE